MGFNKQIVRKLRRLTQRMSAGEFNQGYTLGHEDGEKEGEEYGYQHGFIDGKREAESSFKAERDQYEAQIMQLKIELDMAMRNYLRCVKEHPQRNAPRPYLRSPVART